MDQHSTPELTDNMDLSALAQRWINFARQYGKSILLFSLGGVILSAILYLLATPVYTSRMILRSYVNTNTENIRVVEAWQRMIVEKEFAGLATLFEVPETEVSKLIAFNAGEIQKLYIPNNPNGFYIEATVTDPNMFDSVQNWIIRGFSKGNYLDQKLALHRENLRSLVQSTGQEIDKLDSLKQMVSSDIEGHGSSTGKLTLDISSLNQQALQFREKLLSYQEELAFTNPVQVIARFEKFHKPSSPHLIKYLTLGFLAGLVIGYFISLLRALRRSLT